MRDILFLVRGNLAKHAAERAGVPGALAPVELSDTAVTAIALGALSGEDRVAVLLSDTSTEGLDELAVGLRAAGVRWTSGYAASTMIRIGPVVDAEGPCFDCATRRYLSAPGGSGLRRFEKFVQSGGAGRLIEFEGYPATAAEMMVAEAIRQLTDPAVPAGFIRKVSLLDFSVTDAVATAIHGCACARGGGESGESDPGARFHRRLEQELSDIFGEAF
jgi:hypothetical protein